MDIFEYVQGGSELLDQVAPLWDGLNRNHAGLSSAFAETYLTRRFADRRRDLLAKAESGGLRVDLVRPDAGEFVGYCVSTITAEGHGEIDSIYIDDRFRRSGIGSVLMERALTWLDNKNARSIIISVAAGNEGVFRFYEKFGFYPRITTLLRKKTSR